MMSTDTLKWAISGGMAATTVDDAVRLLYERDDHTVIIYAYSRKKIADIFAGIFSEVKRRNSLIQNIDEQMLISTSDFEAVHKCMHTYAVEIDMGSFARKATLAHPFSDVKYGVLTDPTARKPLSSKALTSLAMIGYMTMKGKCQNV